jgi:hypothetical protein
VRPQPLLLDRPFALQVVIAVVLPAAFGLLCGFLLGASSTGYAIASILGILGGLAAGYDHLGSDQGFVRGVCGGVLFGVFILVGHSIFTQRAKASIPHPHVILPIITSILGGILGAIGGGRRAKRESRGAAQPV